MCYMRLIRILPFGRVCNLFIHSPIQMLFMRPIFCSFLLILTTAFHLSAQTGCPGCQVSVPAGFPADTIYLPAFPDGLEGQPYNKDYSFRMPKTTTPVAAVDSTVPPNLPISSIEILSLDGLPQGLSWQPNAFTFDPSNQTDGCIKICGTPLEADSFVLTVRIKVTVFIISQEAEFPLRLYIAPKVSVTDGFSMTDFTGCGTTTVSFTNNVPSNGDPGFSYTWDFGDNTVYYGENPPPHAYNYPGLYQVSYQAVIDTVGYILLGATVLDVECVDDLGLGDPDLYLLIKNSSGQIIYQSGPDVNNADLPLTFPLNIELGDGNYVLEVWDEDSGLKGSDDACGSVTFNNLSNGTLTSGGFAVNLTIVHPTDTVFSYDTVLVFAQPPAPAVSAPNGLEKCSATVAPILLVSGADTLNQWLMNGILIPGAVQQSYTALETGLYQVQVTDLNGCSSTSDPQLVLINTSPATPLYENDNNLLRLMDTTALPDQYSLQWFFNGEAIPGATGFTYCMTQSGVYGLIVVDESNGCVSFYAATTDYNPAFDCLVGVRAPVEGLLQIYPNPAVNMVWLRLPTPARHEATLSIWDMSGRMVSRFVIPALTENYELNCAGLPAGMFTIQVNGLPEGPMIGKLVLSK